jgi:Transglycosylase SLT domain
MTNRYDIASQPASNMDRVSRAIGVAADRTGVDFDYLMNQARVESGFRADAKASTSSASGLFQFTQQTWLATLKQHGTEHNYGWAADAISAGKFGHYSVSDPQMRGQILELRNQPEAASVMAAEFAADNGDVLASALGREPEAVDLYLAHFLGSGGATKFLKAWQTDPSQPAATLFPAAASANKAIFYGKGGSPRTLNEIRERFKGKMGGDFGRPASAPPTIANRRSDAPRAPMEFRAIEPMPQKLSIAFAKLAYVRLAGLSAGGV